MGLLDGKIALVTGASRGVGRGTAIALAREGATVAIAARTLSSVPGVGSLEEVASAIEEAGGTARPVECDITDAKAVGALVQGVVAEFGQIDLLVNNGQTHGALTQKFWELPISDFDDNMAVSARAYYVATHAAAPSMIARGGGCIVNISSPGSASDFFSAPYSVSRAMADRITQAVAHDLRGTGVRAYSLWPAFIRTERVLRAAAGEAVGLMLPPGFDPMTNANSPEMVGLAIAHLAADTQEAERIGTIVTLNELSQMYGFTDLDGRPAVKIESVQDAVARYGHVVPSVYAQIRK